MTGRLSGKIALITGAARGIGCALPKLMFKRAPKSQFVT